MDLAAFVEDRINTLTEIISEEHQTSDKIGKQLDELNQMIQDCQNQLSKSNYTSVQSIKELEFFNQIKAMISTHQMTLSASLPTNRCLFPEKKEE